MAFCCFRCGRWPCSCADGCSIILGDCLGVLVELVEPIDSLLTDPPYCSGGYLEAQKSTKAQGLRGATVAGAGFKWFRCDNMGTGGLLWLLRSVLVQGNRLLRDRRSAFVFTDWRMVPHLAVGLESSGLRWRNLIFWDKGSAGLGCGFKPAHEIVLEFAKGSPEYQSRRAQNVLRSPRVPAARRRHRAEKPVEILREIVRVAVPPGGLVLDPFMGSGAVLEAARVEGRRALGIEADPDYCQAAADRLG